MSGLPSAADGGSEAEDGNPRSSSLLFEPVSAGPAWDAAVALLAGGLAEHGAPDEAAVRAWCAAGEVYALVDVAAGADEPLPAAAVVRGSAEGAVELALVVAPGPGGADLRRRLLDELCDSLRRRQVPLLVVRAPESDVALARALRAAGFRPHPTDEGWSSLAL